MHPLSRIRPVLLLLPVALALWACESDESDESDDGLVVEVPEQECASGLRWVGGDEESPRMHPGGDCIGCHESRGEGPRYLVAGTVYELLDEPDDCFGIEGATVEITDDDGQVWSLPTNAAGNFYLPQSEGPLAFPYVAAVILDGRRVEMLSRQSSGRCATCHTATGRQGAFGRVVVLP